MAPRTARLTGKQDGRLRRARRRLPCGRRRESPRAGGTQGERAEQAAAGAAVSRSMAHALSPCTAMDSSRCRWLPQWVAGLGVQNLHCVGCNRTSEPLCPVMGSPAPGGDEGPGRRPAGQSPVQRGRAEPPTLLAVAPGRVTACAGSPPPGLQQANGSRETEQRGQRDSSARHPGKRVLRRNLVQLTGQRWGAKG